MPSFEEQFSSDTKEHGIGQDKAAWYKAKDGENKIRILSTPEFNQSRYNYGTVYDGAEWAKKENLGKNESLTNRWLTWIIDRADEKMKLYNMPYSISKELVSLKTNAEYAFDDFPMPYDITIKVKGAGTKEVEYSVLPARKETPVTEEENARLAEQSLPSDIIASMKEKSRQKFGDASSAEEAPPTEDINPEEIPF